MKEKSPHACAKLIQQGAVCIDVRSTAERLTGFIRNSQHIELTRLLEHDAQLPVHPDETVVMYCAHGQRSQHAADQLSALGYSHVYSMIGGFTAWQAEQLPQTYTTSDFSPRESARYARHFSVPEIGPAGQLKLREATVCIIGAGGLGSPAAYYLAAAGVGHLILIDNDQVELSNLQRQILHNDERVGHAKVNSAAQTLRALNPDIHVTKHNTRLNETNALELLQQADIIIDGSDNFATRYVVNDTCIALDKPFVFGSVYRFEGQLSLFWPGRGPCYRCLYPEAPPAELAPSCADAGVLGVVPGIIGSMQAAEAMKFLLEAGDTLLGRLLCFDALTMQVRELTLAVNPSCACQK